LALLSSPISSETGTRIIGSLERLYSVGCATARCMVRPRAQNRDARLRTQDDLSTRFCTPCTLHAVRPPVARLAGRADLPGATIAHLCREHPRRTVPRQSGRDERPVEGLTPPSASTGIDECRGGPAKPGR